MLDEPRKILFARLFNGRWDAYGTEEGGCHRSSSPSWDHHIQKIDWHLDNDCPTGVYPMVKNGDGWTVNWGCVDFDEGDEVSFIHALNVQTVLEAFGLTAWVERSRSKGYHVWLFGSEPIPAALMRRSLYAACQIAKAPTKEINPKQEHLEEGKIGNYVRLPYPMGWQDTQRRCMVDTEGDAIDVRIFVDLAFPTRADASDLQPLLEFYKPPAVIPLEDNGLRVGDDGELPPTRNMNSTAYMVWKEGPFEGADRSSALWKLAVELKKSGYGHKEATAFVYDADKRWGKHHSRGDLHTLDKMLDKVYMSREEGCTNAT